MTDPLWLACIAGLVAGLAGFCYVAREFADLDPTDEFIDELVQGDCRLPDGFLPVHKNGDSL